MYTSFRPSSVGDFFSQIHEGMVVYDRESKRVGVVEFIKFTDENAFQNSHITPEGYVRVDGGFLAPDWVVLFDQLAYVTDDVLMLNVGLDDLISL